MNSKIIGLAASAALAGLAGCATYDKPAPATAAAKGGSPVMPAEVLAAAGNAPITQFIAGQPNVAAIIWIPIIPDQGSVQKATFGQPTAIVIKDQPGGPPGSGGTITTDANGNIDMTNLKVNGDVVIIVTLPVVTYQGTTSFPWSFYQGPQGNDSYQALGIANCAKRGCDPELKPIFGKGAFPDNFTKPIILGGVGLDAMMFIDTDDKNMPYYYQIQVTSTYAPGVTQILDPEIKNRGGSN